MSLASVWAALVVSTEATDASTEAARPAGLTVADSAFTVNRNGTLNISGPSSDDLTVAQVTSLRNWINDTFGPLV